MTFFLLLASCAPARAAESTATVPPPSEPTSTSEPVFTATALPAIPTLPPTVTATHTPVPCDPFTADFCITDGSFLLQRPVLTPANVSVDRTYPYASTADGTRDPHHGVEIQGKFGTPVHAAADGVVQFAGPDREAVYSPWRDFYGNLVVIRHTDDLYTLYGHLSKIEVQVGDSVAAGQKIGEMGQSGAATGSHLHFEVRGDADDYFSTLNPELWLFHDENDAGAVALSVVNDRGAFQRTSITIQRVDETDNIVASYYVDTYHPSLVSGLENAALGGLSAGRYRIALIFNGQVYERWVEVQSGRLTQVVIVVK